MSRQRTVTFLFFLLFSLGCDPASRSSQSAGFSVRDSAGVALASNSAPDRWLIPEEALRFGVIGGDTNLQFDGIRDLKVDDVGGLWVCDSHESIRYYDASGRFVRAIGGKGEGPGEAPSGWGAIWLSQRSLMAYGYGSSLELFDLSGGHLASKSFTLGPGQQVIPLGAYEEKWLFLETGLPTNDGPPYFMSWTVGQGSETSTDIDPVFTLPGRGLTKGSTDFEWSNGSYFDGTHSISNDQLGRVYHSHNLDYRVEVFSPSGSLERVIGRQVELRPYRGGLREDIESGVRSALEELSGGVREAELRRIVENALPKSDPDHLPALDLILTSAEGDVWAQRADAHPRPAMRAVAAAFGMVRGYWLEDWKAPWVFDLFTPEGGYRGSIELPTEFMPLAVTADRVYGFITDSLDVQYVVAFSIPKDG